MRIDKRVCHAITSLFADMFHSPSVWAAIFFLLVFAATANTFGEGSLLIIVQSLIMAVTAKVLILYGKIALGTFRERSLIRDSQLFLGIMLACLGTFLRSALIISWHIQYPNRQAQGIWFDFFNYMILLGYILHVLAPKIEYGHIPLKNTRLLSAFISAGLVIAWVVIWFGVSVS